MEIVTVSFSLYESDLSSAKFNVMVAICMVVINRFDNQGICNKRSSIH